MLSQQLQQAGQFTLGVRPEYVALVAEGTAGALQATVAKVQDVGTYWLVGASVGPAELKLRLTAQAQPPAVGERVWLQVLGAHTCFYGRDEQLINQKEVLS